MKYFLIAGEASGDQHAGRLIKAIGDKDKGAEFLFLGGDRMSEFGQEPVVHIKDMAFMGFTQVLRHLGKIRINFRKAKEAILSFNPDVIIFVDYPGFNMRMAKWAKSKGFRTYYYILPSVWAWNTKRIYKLRKHCDMLYSILPFEREFYHKHGMDIDYVGNPVFEDIKEKRKLLPDADRVGNKQIALLPGSRKQEIQRILPEMLSVISDFPDYNFVIAGMSTHKDLYKSMIPDDCKVKIVFDRALEVLNDSCSALVTSGTATLETSLMGVPQLVCYKAGNLSYRIAKKLVKVKYISLVNLILDGPAVPELIQHYFKREYIRECLKSILPDGANYQDQLEISDLVCDKLGASDASTELASLIVSRLNSLG